MATDAAAGGIHEEDVLGKVYDGRLVRRLLAYVRPYRTLVFFALVALLAEALLQLVGPILTRTVVDRAQALESLRAAGAPLPAHPTAFIWRAVLIFTCSLVAQFGCSYADTLLTSLLGQRVMRDLRIQLFAHLQQLPIAFFDRNPVGRLITRVTSDVEALNELFTAGVVAGFGDLFTLAVIAVWMVVVDWRLALAAFGVIPLVVLTSHVFRIKVRRAYREIRTRLARINAFLQERLTGMRIVQLFGREHREAKRFEALNRAHLDANLDSITYYALYFPAIEILTSVALASLLVAAATRVHLSTLSVGTVAAFLQLVRRFFQPLQDLSDKYNTLQQAMASSERIFKLLDEPIGLAAGVVAWPPPATIGPERDGAGRAGAGAASTETGTADAVGARGIARSSLRPVARTQVRGVTVAFEDVWFAYDVAHMAAGAGGGGGRDAAPDWVLRGVSFRASPGETIAIVGHTGAGKTTIVSLLMRFYDPQRGRITLDGVDIRDMPVDELRARIGYVQQDIFLFAGDVASNIRLSSALSDDEVERAAARVGADRVIKRLPGGYHYRLGERGASISVGERQLLSFARAIAADPALLILDEATSAVDSEIEAEIQAALAELMRGRTTIAIAHRLSTIVDADEILVMQHGEIRERGTHRDLLAQGGLYDRLYRLQVGESAAAV
jgi:ATP-binding cassette subfamily B multidrug efflux pump